MRTVLGLDVAVIERLEFDVDTVVVVTDEVVAADELVSLNQSMGLPAVYLHSGFKPSIRRPCS